MVENELSQLAADVAERRDRAGLSQEALAAKSGVSRSTVQAIEAGRRVRRGNLRAVMETLGEEAPTAPRAADAGRLTIDDFLAQDGQLDDEARAHFRNQYDLLATLSEYRRRTGSPGTTGAPIEEQVLAETEADVEEAREARRSVAEDR